MGHSTASLRPSSPRGFLKGVTTHSFLPLHQNLHSKLPKNQQGPSSRRFPFWAQKKKLAFHQQSFCVLIVYDPQSIRQTFAETAYCCCKASPSSSKCLKKMKQSPNITQEGRIPAEHPARHWPGASLHQICSGITLLERDFQIWHCTFYCRGLISHLLFGRKTWCWRTWFFPLVPGIVIGNNWKCHWK